MTPNDTQPINTLDQQTVQSTRDSEIDERIAAYKRDVDYGLLRENLKYTVEQRLIRLMQLQKFFEEMQAAGRRVRKADD